MGRAQDMLLDFIVSRNERVNRQLAFAQTSHMHARKVHGLAMVAQGEASAWAYACDAEAQQRHFVPVVGAWRTASPCGGMEGAWSMAGVDTSSQLVRHLVRLAPLRSMQLLWPKAFLLVHVGRTK